MERRGIGSGTIIGVIVLVILAIGFGGLLIYEKNENDKRTAAFEQQQNQIRSAKHEKEKKIIVELDKVNAVIDAELPEIICWGDEYMLGTKSGTLPDKLENEIASQLFADVNDGLKTSATLSSKVLTVGVTNNGLRGEDMYTMAARIGAYPILTAEEIELPKGASETKIDFVTNDNKSVNFVSQNAVKLGECTLEEEKGNIVFKKLSDNEYEYYFSKNTPSEPKTITAGSRLFTKGEETHRDDVLILFFGREDNVPRKELIDIEKAVVNHQNANRDKYIVIAQTGMGSGYDKAMQKAFGEHYLRIDPYEYDQTDNVEIAAEVYRKLDTLGYTSKIKEAVATAKVEIDKINEG